MKSRTIITCIILSVAAAAIASACSSGPGEEDDAPCRQVMAEAGLPDEEKIMYDLYREKQEQGDRQHAMKYAGMLADKICSGQDGFPECMDSSITRMISDLADWYENDRYLYSLSIRYGEEAASGFETLGMEHDAAREKYRLARVYYKTGKYHKALKLLSESMPVFKENGDTGYLLDSWNMLGVLNYMFKDYDASNHYFRIFLEGAKEKNDSARYAIALNNTALYSNTVKDSTKTGSLIEESIAICRAINDSSLLCTICANICAVKINSRDFDEAGHYFSLSWPLLKTPPEFGHWYMNSGISNILQGNHEEAVDDIEKAIGYFSKGEFNLQLQACYRLQSSLLAEKRDTAGAYSVLMKYHDLEESIASEEMVSELYKFQNEIIESQKREQEIIRSKTSTTLWIAGISSAIILTILALWARRNRISGAKEIREKNKMLELLKMQQFQMERLTEDITAKLLKARLEMKDKFSRDKINEICSELKHSKDENQWKEFSTFIPELDSEFSKALTARYPELTINERRLCILLNMNLSTKEISEITRQSTQSINTARTRLRNKLGLTGKDISFQEFFSKIK